MPKERIAADRGADVLPTMGRARLLQPEGRADHGAGALIAARGARRPWGGRACCSPRGAPTMGRGFPPNEANVPADHGRARLLQPEGRADHGRAGLSQPEGRADHGAGALVAAAPRQNLQILFSDHVLWQAVRGRKTRRAARHTGRLQGESMAKREGDFLRRLDRSAF